MTLYLFPFEHKTNVFIYTLFSKLKYIHLYFLYCISFPRSMLWITAQLTLLLLVFHCLVQCTAPVPARKNEKLSTKEPAKNKLKTTPEIKLPKTGAKPTAKAKVTATTRKVIQKKTTTPAPLSEFSLDDILFRGRQSSK